MSLFEDVGGFEGFEDSIYPDHVGTTPTPQASTWLVSTTPLSKTCGSVVQVVIWSLAALVLPTK